VVGELPVFETVLFDHGAKYVGLHDFIMLHGRHHRSSGIARICRTRYVWNGSGGLRPQVSGFEADPLFTADRMRCFQPRYRSVGTEHFVGIHASFEAPASPKK
jgi:hypothetical protein